MSLKTAFLNLFKPEAGDKFSITGTEGYNKNMDLIDKAVKKNADDITQLNSKILKHGQVDVTVTFPSGFSTLPIQTASEFNDTLRLYGITTVYAIWIDNGYGDQWQLTASTYNGGLSLQCYSKWGGSLERGINIHILGI